MTSTGPDRRIHPWEPMPAFHGDNTGVWQAMGQLAAMNERLGRADRAAASAGGSTFGRLVPLMPRMRPEKAWRFPTPSNGLFPHCCTRAIGLFSSIWEKT